MSGLRALIGLVPVILAVNGLPDSPTWTFARPIVSGIGTSLACAGDVNGDGIDDLIVGAPYERRVFVFYGNAGTGLSDTYSWTATDSTAGQELCHFGESVCGAGDVNGDGFDDVIIGAPEYESEPIQSGEGKAYLFLGSADGLEASPAWTCEGPIREAKFGTSVSGAGDVNHDGYDDVVIGCPYFGNAQAWEGLIQVFYGSAAGLPSSPSWTVEGNQEYSTLGMSVGRAGDLNGDGVDDIVVGQPGYANAEQYEGRVCAYYGASSGLPIPPVPSWTFESNEAGAQLGKSVAGIGDINRDGFADIAAGAPNYGGLTYRGGRVYVFLGGEDGVQAAPSWTAEMDGYRPNFGSAVAAAGDVNGDGYADLLVGTANYSTGAGAAHLYLGHPSGMLEASPWTKTGSHSYDGNGNVIYDDALGRSLGVIGDVNGDGITDVAIGVPGHDFLHGRVDVYYGQGLGASALRQVRLNGSTPIPFGAVTLETGFVVNATPVDSSDTGALVLEVEVREAGALTPLFTVPSQPVPSGQPASVTVTGLARGLGYQWQGRIRNTVTNATSPWRKIRGSTGAAAEVHFSVRTNTIPTIASLAQIDAITQAPMPTGAGFSRETVSFRAVGGDDDADPVRLQVEARKLEPPFTVQILEGEPSPVPATLTITGTFPAGTYIWRARMVDVAGESSPWMEFGGAPSFNLYGGSVNDAGCLGSAGPGSAGLLALAFLAALLARPARR